MAQSTILKSFDPHGTHFFTNNNVLQRCPPPANPSSHPLPIPASSTQYTANAPAHMQTSTSTIIHSPEPRRPITLINPQKSLDSTQQRHPKPIFTLFHQDRSSPELEEILLRKKLAKTLGPAALGKQPSS